MRPFIIPNKVSRRICFLWETPHHYFSFWSTTRSTMKVACFLLTAVPLVVGQPSPCPTRPVTNPYQDMYRDMFAPDRDVRCCKYRVSPTDPVKPGPPLPGDSCLNPVKTCLFGSQTCPDGSIHPTTRSDCDPASLRWINSPVECPLCPDANACCASAPRGSICGIAMQDTRPFNGIGDAPLSVASLRLLDQNNDEVASFVTDNDGCFILDVPRGPYTVVKTTPPGFTPISDASVILFDSFHYTARTICFLDQAP